MTDAMNSGPALRASGRADAALLIDTACGRTAALGHNEVTTAHLLLALLDGFPAAADLLAELGVRAADLESALLAELAVHRWRPFPVPRGEFPPLGRTASEVCEEAAAGASEQFPARLLAAVLHLDHQGPGRIALHTVGLTTRQVALALDTRLSA
ncbi:Clp protease N-terminal domain-containing protein [Kitasatospora sp. NPDC088134]|uniref:Clp protease N-terminal domain-containing protein n=1 Tax=Kitasatospora sp. NPDC088134 TaxID=3364071 RepID=UPI003801FF8B